MVVILNNNSFWTIFSRDLCGDVPHHGKKAYPDMILQQEQDRYDGNNSQQKANSCPRGIAERTFERNIIVMT